MLAKEANIRHSVFFGDTIYLSGYNQSLGRKRKIINSPTFSHGLSPCNDGFQDAFYKQCWSIVAAELSPGRYKHLSIMFNSKAANFSPEIQVLLQTFNLLSGQGWKCKLINQARTTQCSF